MFEIPEYTTLARQMNETLAGKTIQRGTLSNSPHKFVWYNRTHDEFENLACGKRVNAARVRVPWAAAVLITLVYRAVTFWFPLAVGGVAFRLLQQSSRSPALKSGS